MKIKNLAFFLLILLFATSCNKNNQEKVIETTTKAKTMKTDDLLYSADGKNYKSFVAYDPNSTEAKPVIFVIPEWWGLNDYAKNRAKQLAELGYFAVALDFYGDGKNVDNPTDAQKLAEPFYKNSALGKAAFDAGRSQLKNFKIADVNKVAVIGYCFGGAQALNMGRQENDLKGVVSFHGNLMTGVKPNNNAVKYLICNGEADTFVPKEEIANFKKEMDSAKISYKFIDYPGAVHAFTNPASTAMGKKFDMKVAYNKEADERSWSEMKAFFIEIFK